LDTYPISSNSLEKFYKINGNHFAQQYKAHLSDYKTWNQREHAQDWILYPNNIGEQMSIDETSLSNGELYTVLTNKSGTGKKGTLAAIIEGTNSEKVISIIEKITEKQREKVKEITLDISGSMGKISRICFPKATIVIDRFHVQKLAHEALQEMRIKHRWDVINKETNLMSEAKLSKTKYEPEILSNSDTEKQLLARSRYLLFKSGDKWTFKQKERAKLLFERYPDLKKGYSLTQSLKSIFSNTEDKKIAYTKLAKWYNDVSDSDFKSFNTIAGTIHTHYPEILNFFDNRSTNASAESFNAKIKAFRATQKGVTDIPFFLFRLAKIYS